MVNQPFSKICERCEKRYLTFESDKNFCTDTCKFKKLYCQKRKVKDISLAKADKQCKNCGEPTKNKFCNTQCCDLYLRNQKAQERLKKSFIDLDKPKKKGLSYDELNRRAEWKRLNYDESWMYKNNRNKI